MSVVIGLQKTLPRVQWEATAAAGSCDVIDGGQGEGHDTATELRRCMKGDAGG